MITNSMHRKEILYMYKQRKDLKQRIIKSLYSYPKHKDMLEMSRAYLQFYNDMNTFIEVYLQTSSEMLVNVSLVNSIDSALTTLPPEIKAYADLKYFRPNYCTADGLAMKLNVNKRTLQRWDDLLTTTIESYFITTTN